MVNFHISLFWLFHYSITRYKSKILEISEKSPYIKNGLGIGATPKAATGLSERVLRVNEGRGCSDSGIAESPTAACLPEPPNKKEKLPAIAVCGPFGAAGEQVLDANLLSELVKLTKGTMFDANGLSGNRWTSEMNLKAYS